MSILSPWVQVIIRCGMHDQYAWERPLYKQGLIISLDVIFSESIMRVIELTIRKISWSFCLPISLTWFRTPVVITQLMWRSNTVRQDNDIIIFTLKKNPFTANSITRKQICLHWINKLSSDKCENDQSKPVLGCTPLNNASHLAIQSLVLNKKQYDL
jgi:hypothetical protein